MVREQSSFSLQQTALKQHHSTFLAALAGVHHSRQREKHAQRPTTGQPALLDAGTDVINNQCAVQQYNSLQDNTLPAVSRGPSWWGGSHGPMWCCPLQVLDRFILHTKNGVCQVGLQVSCAIAASPQHDQSAPL
jgi:hypothetical protein